MKAYKIEARNSENKKTRKCIQFADNQEESDKLAEYYIFSDEHITLNEETEPESEQQAALFNFAALFQADKAAYMVKHHGGTGRTPTEIINIHIGAWPVKIVYGRKYINVDAGGSGAYMVVKETGDIYSTKAYGVIHKGHHFGTLETISEWYWGDYRAYKAANVNPAATAFTFSTSEPEQDFTEPESTQATEKATSTGRGRVSVSEDVETILRNAETEGNALRITEELDRPSYNKVNKVLAALGGKWNKAQKVHIFPRPISVVLSDALDAGQVIDTKKALGQFDTPSGVAQRVVNLVSLTGSSKILEPEAGTGNILEHIPKLQERAALGLVNVCELDPYRAAELRKTLGDSNVKEGDFLTADIPQGFDVVLMNPPFTNGADIKHINHAFSKLVDGGVLVAVCANGPKQRAEFEESADLWEELPEGSFKQAGTNVNTVIIRLRKK